MAGTFAWVLPIAGNLRRNHAVRPEARWHLLRKNYDLNFPRRGGWQGRSFFALIVPRILALHVNHFDNHSEKCLADLMMPWWSAVTVTPSRIGKSVTVTDCHSNSSFLRALKWPIFEQNPSIFGWDMTQNGISPHVWSKETRSGIQFSVISQQILMDFASIWVIFNVKSCWAALI